ncbi:MAG: ComEA family DNA-binding protein [Eubacteriales bacterium]|jgi:competence protein ComEA
MKKNNAMSMRVMALLLTSVLAAGILFSGCGATSYEAVYTGQSKTSGENPSSAENLTESSSKPTEGTSSGASSGRKSSSSVQPENGGEICVYICGAVVSPGVYFLGKSARVIDAVNAAGGLREDADSTHTNLAAALQDGQQITVPTVEEAKSMPAAAGTTAAASAAAGEQLVNINTADAAALQTLSGIGASRAADIIAYRNEHGPFRSIEEITNVSGIGSALFEKIKDHITVG